MLACVFGGEEVEVGGEGEGGIVLWVGPKGQKAVAWCRGSGHCTERHSQGSQSSSNPHPDHTFTPEEASPSTNTVPGEA